LPGVLRRYPLICALFTRILRQISPFLAALPPKTTAKHPNYSL
jgi:hypothetical protein